MTITQIYKGKPENGIANTDLFIDGSAIFMVAPDITDELELDFYLQVIVNTENRLVKLNSEYRLETVSIFPVPEELRNAKLSMYGVILTTFPIDIEVYVIFKETDIENRLQEILEEIQGFRTEFRIETAREIASDIATALASQQTNFGLGILSASLAPLTLGASASAVPVFAGATGILTPVTLIGLLP